MSKKLNETIGAVEYDCIFNGACNADVVTVQLAANSGVLKRGTVLVSIEGCACTPIASSLDVSASPFILADDVDTSVTTVATAYRNGHFNRNKLITNGSYALSKGDEGLLRVHGILLDDAIEI